MTRSILLVEDTQSLAMVYRAVLEKNGFQVESAKSLFETRNAIAAREFSTVLLDLMLPDGDGMDVISEILSNNSETKVIVITANGSINRAIDAMRLGAFDYLVKPFDEKRLINAVRNADKTFVEAAKNPEDAVIGELGFRDFIGLSPAMIEIYKMINNIGRSLATVFITGESGTGKELIAKAIHKQSMRQDKPFVPINCGAIPENLMESELFGHEKGAFTGAHIRRKGKIEAAEGGTFFLDEIGELPLALQVKLLRFLQDHRIERVGGRESIEVDLRIIAATNKDIKVLASEEKFREDLYYRLAVLTIDLPPLRERGEDIMILTKVFLKKFSTGNNKPKQLSHDAVEAINGYDWPGNVRELENRLHRAMTMSEGTTISPGDIGLGSDQYSEQILDLKKARENVDRKFIYMAIMKNNGNISKAAEELGLSRPTLHNLLKKYKIG